MHIPFRPLKEKNATSFLLELLMVVSAEGANHLKETYAIIYNIYLNETYAIIYNMYVLKKNIYIYCINDIFVAIY